MAKGVTFPHVAVLLMFCLGNLLFIVRASDYGAGHHFSDWIIYSRRLPDEGPVTRELAVTLLREMNRRETERHESLVFPWLIILISSLLMAWQRKGEQSGPASPH